MAELTREQIEAKITDERTSQKQALAAGRLIEASICENNVDRLLGLWVTVHDDELLEHVPYG